MALKIVLSTWYAITGLAAMVGNGMVLWFVAGNRSLRTLSNLFLTSLAAADFLVGLVIEPVWISIRQVAYTADHLQTYGKAIDYLWIHTTVATSFNLCCVTLDRNIAICHPLRYEDIVTDRRCYVPIATVWFMSLVLPCSRFLVTDAKGQEALWLSFLIITMLVPMIIFVFCSIRNFKAAAVQSRRISNNTLRNHDQDDAKRRKKNFKAVKTISIVVGLLIICWLPVLVTSFVDFFDETSSFPMVWIYVEAVALTSSAINPWVYCLRGDDFYDSLSRTFRCQRGQNSNRNALPIQLRDQTTGSPSDGFA
ncbi:beta-4C adrenergic receptor-like [Oculina patagonica]